MSNITIPSIPTDNSAKEQVSTMHNNLLKMAENNAAHINPIGEAEPLISYNGYYALNETGAFLSVDTNLIVNSR